MVKSFFIQHCNARMEYKQIYQRLSEEPLIVLEQVLHDVSEIYQNRVQQNIQECGEQNSSKVAAVTSDEPEGDDDNERSSTADSSASSLATGSDPFEAVKTSNADTKANTAPMQDREILKNLDDNVEGDSDHSDKATSNEDEAEGTAVKRDVNSKVENTQDDLSSRLRTRPVVKRFIDKKYGTIVGIDSLKKPPPRKSSCAESAAAQTESKPRWTAKLVKRLTQGVKLYQKTGWDRVAEHVGGSITAQQCAQRWRAQAQVAPTQKIRRRWSNAELTKLARLAKQHVIPSQWSESQQTMLPERIDWFHVAQVLERTPKSCYNKHSALQSKVKA